MTLFSKLKITQKVAKMESKLLGIGFADRIVDEIKSESKLRVCLAPLSKYDLL